MGLLVLIFLVIICLGKFWLWMNKRDKQNLSTATDLRQTNESIDPIYDTISFADESLAVTNVNHGSSHNETDIERDLSNTHDILMRNASSPLHVTTNEAYVFVRNIELTNNESYQYCVAQMSSKDTSSQLDQNHFQNS